MAIFLKDGTYHMFWCVGCDCGHAFDIKEGGWTLTMDGDSPTVSPSLLTNRGDDDSRCHLFIRDGQLQYLNDCAHDLSGQTVPMVDFHEQWHDDTD